MKVNKKTIVAVIVGLAVLIGIYIAILSILSSLKKIESAFSPSPQAVPCNGNPASKIEIEYPAEKPSDFTTIGGDIFVIIKNVNNKNNDVLDNLLGAFATIRIGKGILGAKSLSLLPPEEVEKKTIVKLDVIEDKYNKVTLESGQYWLWVNNGTKMEILSCTPNGVSNPLPSK